MTSLPVEIVILGFDGTRIDSARSFITGMNDNGQIKVISALLARREIDGSASAEDWTDATDVFDLVADLTARSVLGLDGVEAIEIAKDLAPGTSVLILLIAHVWALSLEEELAHLGGHYLATLSVAPERLRGMERQIARLPE